VLPTLPLLGKIAVNPDSLFKALKEKLPNNGCECRRMGGPGGKARFDQILFDFVHRGGTTCRRGTGVILERAKDGRNWILIYESGCSQKFKRVCHSPPVVGGQVDPSRVDWCNDSLTGFRQVCAGIKTMLQHIFDAVNQASPSHFSFAVSAIKDELHCISEAFTEARMNDIPFEEAIVKKHTITLLLTPVMLHRDIAHSSAKRGDQDCSFLEHKFVFEVPSETAKFSTVGSPVARLRGGAGRRKAAVAMASHKKK
jgi:hypothetical protein